MINRFLKAKHWQLFMLTFGIPMVLQLILVGFMMANIFINNTPDPESIVISMGFFAIIMMIFMGVYYGWFWSVAIGLHRIIPTDLKLKVNRFKVFLLFPGIYILFFLGFFMSSFDPNGINPALFAVILPLHLFSMFCIFYCLYFVAKTFKTAELQREVSFSDYAGEFFMIWFYPIGIWIIQPKINAMINKKEHILTVG